jgi:hypothetical protein
MNRSTVIQIGIYPNSKVKRNKSKSLFCNKKSIQRYQIRLRNETPRNQMGCLRAIAAIMVILLMITVETSGAIAKMTVMKRT